MWNRDSYVHRRMSSQAAARGCQPRLHGHSVNAVLLDVAGTRTRRGWCAESVDAAVEPFQHTGAQRHHDSAHRKQADPARGGQLLEDRIRIPSRVNSSRRPQL